jgi:hypothetical protein
VLPDAATDVESASDTRAATPRQGIV